MSRLPNTVSFHVERLPFHHWQSSCLLGTGKLVEIDNDDGWGGPKGLKYSFANKPFGQEFHLRLVHAEGRQLLSETCGHAHFCLLIIRSASVTYFSLGINKSLLFTRQLIQCSNEGRDAWVVEKRRA